MIYHLKELQGDTIAVPQLVFSKLGIAEEYNVRVALYVLATGITDPDKICADLKLRSRISAESALSFWAGAGLLERYEENAAPGAEPSAPAPMTWAEIAAASRTDPMISSLIDCAQTGFARPLTHREMEKLVNLYVQEGFAPETVMLCVAYVASCGKRTMAAVVHELKVWRTEGVETGEQADAHLKLRSRISAESALAFWAGAGLLERYEENAAPGAEPSAPAPMRWAEIAAASRTDPMISSLIDCAQTSFARPLTHTEMEKLVNLYVQEGFAPETVMLCVAYVASRGKRTMAAVTHELKVWRAEGVETGEQADAHLKLLALRQSREEYVSSLLQITPEELTLGGRKAIARWYEVYGYDDAMVQEAAVQAGPKRDLWYWNSILKTWNAKGLRNIHDVRGPVAAAGASRNIRVDRDTPSGNDILKNATRRRPLIKKPE